MGFIHKIKSIIRKSRKSVLFHRDFIVYTGGHQKVYDYFKHLESAGSYTSSVSFSDTSVWDANNPWFPEYQFKHVAYEPSEYDSLFIAGLDWQQLNSDVANPVVNLIQHVRHADPEHQLYSFLNRKAVRICVSQEVADAIIATGRVNGPVYCIPNGINIPALPLSDTTDFFILGKKQPQLAGELRSKLAEKGYSVAAVEGFIPRQQVLESMARSRIAVLLPNYTEGFYLPALEAMALCDMTVVPDCVGNRSFCLPGQNCIMPDYSLSGLLAGCQQAVALLANQREVCSSYRANALETVAAHSLSRERTKFLEIMDNLDQIW